MIRVFRPSDVDELKRIHALYFSHEENLPDFTKYLCAFVVEDDQGPITYAGIRDIAECVTVTDKSRGPKDRAKALYKVLDAATSISRRFGYDDLYAWSQNPKWARRLMQNGFKPHSGQSLILDLRG